MLKKDMILIVDDVEMNRFILATLFEDQYSALEASDGQQALDFVEKYRDRIAVVLLDLIMPVKTGYEVLEEMKKKGDLREIPVVVITAQDSVESEIRAFDLGALDIIVKPFEDHVIKRRVQNVVELNLYKIHQQEVIDEQAAKIRESNVIMVDALSSIIETRSLETGQHVQRIKMYTKVLMDRVASRHPEYGITGRKLEIISNASSMHDIGKIAIPDSILNKPGPLTKEEFEIMKTHTTAGCQMLDKMKRIGDEEYLQYAYNICRHHHERWDGKGYPDALAGNEIPLCAHVVGVADCYDALTVDRVYRKAVPYEEAYNMIMDGKCGTFAPKLLEEFTIVKGEFERLAKEYADKGV